MSEHVAVSKVTAQTAEYSSALPKLLTFTLALAVGPISAYFLSEKFLWSGNSTYAAITAIVAANLVLVGYIITSMNEDNQTPVVTSQEKTESRKTR
ncbi:hypothetical protein BXZ70DRAFT_918304 [Cristinia sonorae]|uniref:Vacuolar ATPase assembly integral membrane protein VMA21 n=1 Tax=Cristinia sonorae TaxID=1940300 RepID=A0A8K0UXI3_9AGAR|nr:hypothetical protein BXZ70DRAFT_918304 [Cristinia sonorae]